MPTKSSNYLAYSAVKYLCPSAQREHDASILSSTSASFDALSVWPQAPVYQVQGREETRLKPSDASLFFLRTLR